MKKFLTGIVFIAVAAAFCGCATTGSPSGGERDIDPPAVVKYSVEPFTTHFKETKIEIQFNELITLKDLRKQLLVSPPLDEFPDVRPAYGASKKMIIDLEKQELKENTTYIFNFGTSVQDYNENNPLLDFQFVFSTGDRIDSLTLGGIVEDAFEKGFKVGTLVMLYDMEPSDTVYTDSSVYLRKADYVTRITHEKDSTFLLTNLRPGKYKLIAIEDENNNMLFDQGTEKIAFYPDTITLPLKDSLGFYLRMSRPAPAFKAFRGIYKQPGLIQFPMSGGDGQVAVERAEPEFASSDTTFQHFLYEQDQLDTLNYWFTPQGEDSITFHLRHPSMEKTDTINVRLRNLKDAEFTLGFSKNSIELDEDIAMKASKPIAGIEPSKIVVMKKDSSFLDIKPIVDSTLKAFRFGIRPEEEEIYSVIVLPGAVRSIFREENQDTLTAKFTLKKIRDYGTVTLKMPNLKVFPLIVELITPDGKTVVKKQTLTRNAPVKFDLVPPGKYSFRIIHDINGNGQWDPADFLGNRQPEYVKYYPEEFEVKAFWDLEEVWNF